MFRKLILFFIVAFSTLGLVLPCTVQAEEQQTVTLQVENMMCSTCSITVRRALQQIDGVYKATVDLNAHSATIYFDPGKTDVESLIKATTNAGYPSHLWTDEKDE